MVLPKHSRKGLVSQYGYFTHYNLKVMSDLYELYMRSDKWRKKRAEVLERDGHKCQTCLATEGLQVHHKTYKHFAQEPLEDLITLCTYCHHAITTTIRERRFDKRANFDAVSIESSLPKPQLSKNCEPTFEVISNLGIAPKPKGHDKYGTQNFDFSTEIGRPHLATLWAVSRPNEQVGKGNEKDFGQTEQD